MSPKLMEGDMPNEETYLGDGLYGRLSEHDICLRAPRANGNDHVIYLDVGMLQKLIDFARQQGIVLK
jgi:hypothetical protein